MLGTYFTLILALFIVMVVGAVLGYSGDLEKSVKDPLKSALSKYSDVATEDTDPALYGYKMAWNTVQEEVLLAAPILLPSEHVSLVEMLWGGRCD